MPASRKDMQDLINTIQTAFQNIPRPLLTMSDAEVADDWGDESARFEENDTNWQEIPDEFIARYSTVFCYLPPEAKLYYLPAYMSWFLRSGCNSDSASAEHLMCFLGDTARISPVWQLMTQEQRDAVLQFARACISPADEYEKEYYTDILDTVVKLAGKPDN